MGVLLSSGETNEEDEEDTVETEDNEEATFGEFIKAVVELHVSIVPLATLPVLAGGWLGTYVAIGMGYPAIGLLVAFLYPIGDLLLYGALGISATGVGVKWAEWLTEEDEDENSESAPNTSGSLLLEFLREIYRSFSEVEFSRIKIPKWKH
jgi:hypothetical protein